jgi:CubicO group peptidase (beta-lactamase class C family)
MDYVEEIDAKLSNYAKKLDSNLGFSFKIIRGTRDLKSFSALGFSEDSVFPLSSISKTLIGIGISLSGKFRLRAPLTEYLETSWPNITIEDLLNHKSGIPEYIYEPSEEEMNSWSLEECCSYIQRLEISSNKKFLYSNSNYTLLSFIIKKVLGISYDRFIEDFIFTKHKMTNSFSFEDNNRLEESLSPLYYPEGKNWKGVNIKRSLFGWGESSFISSVKDLQTLMQSDLFLNYIEENEKHNADDYVNGSFIQTKNGKRCYFHSGSTIGAESLIFFDPKDRLGLIYLSNHNSNNENELIPSLLSILRDS